ncbi:flagellar basal body-associated FliL family protein [Gemmatimonas groenlandica]|uniref:Flagellar protein FliL n=1 Tax=Gemmatimonas groenlandica TaxID=2732249 RepID=A0A6M4ISE5_9BACT|nr:flagellar basal body-associated FliL family protein [Gemmatimonas groenlandica]QJR36457.1 flagellar basal body-associated FliL family protein [Gemmatimonas groenlandica]
MANETPQAPEGAPVAPTKAKLPMLIGMVAVGLALGGGTGAAVLGPMVAKKMGKVTPIVAAADSAHGGDAAAAEGEHAAPAEGGKEGGAAEAAIHVLDNMVLNPAGSGGSRYLLLTVAIEVGSPAAIESFKARDAELRDIVLTTLGTKPVEQLTDMATREQFKVEIMKAVDERFGKKSVKRIYFPQFVVQ